jgi:hypothetical protein
MGRERRGPLVEGTEAQGQETKDEKELRLIQEKLAAGLAAARKFEARTGRRLTKDSLQEIVDETMPEVEATPEPDMYKPKEGENMHRALAAARKASADFKEKTGFDLTQDNLRKLGARLWKE